MLALCRRKSRNANGTAASQKSFSKKLSILERSSRAEPPEERMQGKSTSNGLHKEFPALRSASLGCACLFDADELFHGLQCEWELQRLALFRICPYLC